MQLCMAAFHAVLEPDDYYCGFAEWRPPLLLPSPAPVCAQDLGIFDPEGFVVDSSEELHR